MQRPVSTVDRCLIRGWTAARRWAPMSTELLDRARGGDGEAFRQVAEPHRRELHVHCYRMLGSLQDAEDALQDTLLAAWRGLAAFEGRSSLRTWLYQVATNRCLNILRANRRRPVVNLAPPRRRDSRAESHRRGDLARALPRRAARVGRTSRPDPKAATRRAKRSRSPSSRHSRRSRRASGPSSSCATSSATGPARSPPSSMPARSRSPVPSNGHGPSSSNGSPRSQNTSCRRVRARPRNASSSTGSPAPTRPATSTRSSPCSPTTSR